jgi:hypothetical protein
MGINTVVQPMIRVMLGALEQPRMAKRAIWELLDLPTLPVPSVEMEHVVMVSPATIAQRIAALATRDVPLLPLQDVGIVLVPQKRVNSSRLVVRSPGRRTVSMSATS